MEMIDLVLDGKRFEELTFSPQHISNAKNTRFVRCAVSPGTCVVEGGAVLENVVFDALNCGDALRISSDASLKDVVVRGAMPNALIVQPDAMASSQIRDGIALDIVDYLGEVSIVGFGEESVRFNKQLHVAVDGAWRDQVDWSSLGIGPFSYWRLYLKKLNAFEASKGVFSLPPRSDKHFQATIDEMRKLKAFGLNLTVPETAGQAM
jgi:hypothetical protein